ncbi:zinc-finger associated domain containing protein, partial [Oryctes borbonicus]
RNCAVSCVISITCSCYEVVSFIAKRSYKTYTMSKLICRLCLNDKKLINIFDSRLTNSEQLRKCILLGTGVEISPNDAVTKYICQYCSDIAIFLYKYRKKALANDRALKELANQDFIEPAHHVSEIARFNHFVLEDLLANEGVERNIIKVRRNESKPYKPKSSIVTNFAVHPTVIDLIKTYPKIKIPNDLLKYHIQPSIVLDKREAENWKMQVKDELILPEPISDIQRFQLMCPSIKITKITQTSEKTIEKAIPAETGRLNNAVNKRKLTISPTNNTSKRKKTNSTSSHEGEVNQNTLVGDEAAVVAVPKQPTNKQILAEDCKIIESSTENDNVTRDGKEFTSPLNPISQQPSQAETEPIRPKRLSRKRFVLLENNSDSESELDYDGSNSYSLLKTVEEEAVVSCGICDKMFNTQTQLSNHERTHRRCLICNKIFRSANVLHAHQQEVCFKNVIANPPNLQLVRVDEQPEIVRLHREAFKTQISSNDNVQDVLCISDDDDNADAGDDDDVVLLSDAKKVVSAQSTINANEHEQICRIFKKYKDQKVTSTKVRSTETKPRICIKYNLKNQIVLEKMYSELQTYRVPVELVAKSSSFAYISFSKKTLPTPSFYCWANEPVIGLSEKKSLLSVLLNTSLHCPEGMSATAQAASLITPPIIIKTAIQQNYSNLVTNTPIQLSTAPNVVTTVVSTPMLLVPALSSVSTTANETIEPTPSTSTAKDSGFGLRVKTLSELL